MPSRARTLLAGLALLGAAFAPAGAQAPAPRVHATYPPAPEDRSPPGVEKFVVFGIDEETPSAWEFVPGTEPARLVKRVAFAKSRLTVRPVHGQDAPDFVQLRRKGRTDRRARAERWRVFHIDYRTWQVRWAADVTESFRVVGRSRGAFYVRVNGALRLFDPATGGLDEPKRPFSLVHDLGRYWLVCFEGDASPHAYRVFDPETRETVTGVRVAPPGRGARYEGDDFRRPLAVSPDGRRVAWLEALGWKEMKKHIPLMTARMESAVQVVDLENGRDHSLPIGFFGVYASSGWNIKHAIGLAFPSPDELTYLSVRSGAAWSSWSGLRVALEAGSVDRVSVTFEPFRTKRRLARPDDRPPARDAREEAPAWIPPYFAAEDVPIEDRGSLFEAFLERHRKRVSLPPRWRPMAYEFSSDGKRFLAFTRRGVKPGEVFFGDLEKDALVPVEGKVGGWTIVRRVRVRDGSDGRR